MFPLYTGEPPALRAATTRECFVYTVYTWMDVSSLPFVNCVTCRALSLVITLFSMISGRWYGLAGNVLPDANMFINLVANVKDIQGSDKEIKIIVAHFGGRVLFSKQYRSTAQRKLSKGTKGRVAEVSLSFRSITPPWVSARSFSLCSTSGWFEWNLTNSQNSMSGAVLKLKLFKVQPLNVHFNHIDEQYRVSSALP